MSARNLTALGLSMGLGVITGVYIFRPALEEQQKSNEFWRDPSPQKPGEALRDDKTSVQNPSSQAPNTPGQGK